MGQSTVDHYSAGHARTSEVPAVWICQRIHVKPNCIKSRFKSFPGSPSHILKCSPDLSRYGLQPPGPLVYQKVFLKQKSVESRAVFWELSIHTGEKCEKETLRKFMTLCVFWIVCASFRGGKKVIFEKMHIILSTRVLFLNLSIWTRSAGPQTVLYLLWQLKQHMVSKEQHSLAQLTSLLVNVQQVICYNCKKLVYIQNRLASFTQSSLTVAITLCGKKYPTVILK